MTTPLPPAALRTPAHRALWRAIRETGTQATLAGMIGKRQSHVEYWLNKSKRGVPGEWVEMVEAASGVPAHELRPDLFKPPVVQSATTGAAA